MSLHNNNFLFICKLGLAAQIKEVVDQNRLKNKDYSRETVLYTNVILCEEGRWPLGWETGTGEIGMKSTLEVRGLFLISSFT